MITPVALRVYGIWHHTVISRLFESISHGIPIGFIVRHPAPGFGLYFAIRYSSRLSRLSTQLPFDLTLFILHQVHVVCGSCMVVWNDVGYNATLYVVRAWYGISGLCLEVEDLFGLELELYTEKMQGPGNAGISVSWKGGRSVRTRPYHVSHGSMPLGLGLLFCLILN
jgi:hypothetical protein